MNYYCRVGLLRLRIVTALALFAPQLAGSNPPDSIVDFEGQNALQNWRVERSPESAEVGGGLALGPGHPKQGAVLTYRLPCERNVECGASVAALWRPPAPLAKKRHPAISLWIRFSPDVVVSLVAKDTRGRALRFPIQATIEHPKAGDWQYAVVTLAGARLVELGIRVQARFRWTVEGSVSFDDVRWQDSSEPFYIDAGAQAEPPRPESSELAPRLGVNIHVLSDVRSLELARAAGFHFVRMDMLWANVERRGRYRFFAYDALLRALEARGMWALWILDYGHPDHGGGVPRTPADVAAFGRFAEAAAEHFKGRNVRYEIWNEPNTPQFWAPEPNAAEYAVLLREAVAAIHRADPSAKVCSGGVSRFDLDFLSAAVDRSLGAGLAAIGVHPYPKTGPETIAPEFSVLNYWVARWLGEGMEIWDTEWGYSSADAPKEAPANGHSEEGRRRQAALAMREILTVWTAGLRLAVWYDLRDDGPDGANPEQNYGLLDWSGNEKPALQAVRNLTELVSGRKYAGMIREIPAGMHAMRLEGSADTVMIVWTDQPEGRRTVEYAKGGLHSVNDLFGIALKAKNKPSGRGRVEIDAAGGPIYFIYSSKNAAAIFRNSGHLSPNTGP